jgi:hypothetical protein
VDGRPVKRSGRGAVTLTPSSGRHASAGAAVRELRRLMQRNDSHSVAAVLASEFVRESLNQKNAFAVPSGSPAMNHEYAALGPWQFHGTAADRKRVRGCDRGAEITDGTQKAKAISFFTVEAGKITRLREYWPEPCPAAANRVRLAEPMQRASSQRRLSASSSGQLDAAVIWRSAGRPRISRAVRTQS